MGLVEKPINPESKGYGNLGRVSSKDLIKTLDQRNKMGQKSPKQCEYMLNDSTGLLELSRRKEYSRPKRGTASISQMITWQK